MTDDQARLIGALMVLSAGFVTMGLGAIARATNASMGLVAYLAGLVAVLAGALFSIVSNARLREKAEKQGKPEEPSRPNE